MRSRVVQVAQAILGLAVIGFVAQSVVRNWDQVRSADLAWSPSPLPLLLGLLVVLVAFALLAEAWRRTVAGWGYQQAWWAAGRIWLLSSMAKYVPGKIWSLAGMAVMAQRRGIPAWAATGSAVLLQLLSIATGVIVVAVSGPAVLRNAGGPGPFGLLLAALLSGAVVAAAVSPRVLRAVLGRFAPEAGDRVPGSGAVGFGLVANLLAWVGYGIAFWLFARGTLPGLPLGPAEAVAASTGAYLAGVLAPFAPGGLGVREGILVLFLRDRTGLGGALALAAVARLGMTLAEVLASIPFLLDRGARKAS